MDNTATNIQFVIAGRSCLVLQLSGEETLNSAFHFSITIEHEFAQLEQYLDQPATLLFRNNNITVRTVYGRIETVKHLFRIEEGLYLSSIELVANLHYSLFLSDSGRHHEKEIISLAKKLLMQGHYAPKQIIVSTNYNHVHHSMFLQLPSENNYNFFLRILASQKLRFYCGYDDSIGEIIHIFDEINNRKPIRTGLFKLSKCTTDEHTSIHHTVTAHSHLANCTLTHTVVIENEFCAGHYYISRIQHHYDSINRIYKNKLELTTSQASSIHPTDNQLDLALCYQGRIINQTSRTELDQLGRYHAYYEFEIDKPTTLGTVPKSYRALINSQSNLPLVDNSAVLLSHVNGHTEQPLIIATQPSAEQPSPINHTNQTQHLLRTASENTVCFNDDVTNNTLHVGNNCFQNKLILHNNKYSLKFSMHNDNGNIKLTANHDINFTSQDEHIRAKQLTYNARNKLRRSSHKGSLLHQSQQAIVLTASNQLQLHANKAIHLSSQQHLQMSAKQSIQLLSQSKLNITTASKLIIQANQQLTLSSKVIQLASGDTGITLNDSQITLNCRQLILQARNAIGFQGRVNLSHQPPRATTFFYPKPLPIRVLALLKHHSILKVTNMHWQHSLLSCNQQQMAIFTLYNDSSQLDGFIDIYHCTTDDELAIDFPAVIDDYRYEHRTKLDRCRFQLQPNKKYQQFYIAYDYQATLHNDNKQYHYLRFGVSLGGRTSYYLSPPMQWCKDIRLTLQSEKQLYYLDPITLSMSQDNILPKKTNWRPHKKQRSTHHYCHFSQTIIGTPCELTVANADKSQVFELLDQHKANPKIFQKLSLDSSEQSSETIPLHLLTPPMIVNARVDAKASDKSNRKNLTTSEYQQISKNGNNLTLFVHGFNISYGQFSKHIQSVNPCDDELNIDVQLSPHDATIYRSAASLKQQFPMLEGLSEQHCNDIFSTLNGSGMHNWLLHMENNINKSVGFDGRHYEKFTRLLHFAWQGDPVELYDYLSAVKQSLLVASKLAALIKQIKSVAPQLQLNIIAHSQGCATVIAAMEELKEPLLDCVILWQAAVAYDCLSPHQFTGRHFSSLSAEELKQYQHKRFSETSYNPFAHQAAKQITILHSYNDNILGPIPVKQSPTRQQRVNHQKPVSELVSALFFSYMKLESLYELAFWVGVPVSCLLTWPGQQHTYQLMKQRFLNKHYPNTLKEQIEINEQQDNNTKLFSQLAQRLSRAKQRIIHQLKKAGHPHLSAIVTVANFAFSHPFWTAFLLGGGAGVATVEKVDDNLTSLTIVKGLFTLLDMLLLNQSIQVKPAMGYCGPIPKYYSHDNGMRSLLDSGKITVVDQSEYYFSHSALKKPSDELLRKAYQGVITNPAIALEHFGTYY